MIRLLDACVKSLLDQGMRKMFLDAMKGGYEGFQSLGKRPTAIGRVLRFAQSC